MKEFCFKSMKVVEKQQQLLGFMETVVNDEHNYGNVTVEVPTTSIKSENATRWSSICIMIETIVKNQAIISILLREWGKNDLLLFQQRHKTVRGVAYIFNSVQKDD